ncbi:hypothetical protein BHK98_09205 [Hornefia porci]|uniref:Uncharacterized protein n=1 Tax=Hornefia porci TaxID=2652292 RepID=A0A1Q9JJ92_9FIRM|nr:hypothetical protein [Hornefia porci]OLR56225.1 hypothetical protein BHK98_09205 [Hornefia porci]
MENSWANTAGKVKSEWPALAGVVAAVLAEGTFIVLAVGYLGGTCAAVIAAAGFFAVLLSAASLCKAAARSDSAA